jgi:hypothetical protein
MLLWASRASSLADHCLLNSDPIGICVRVWAMDFKVNIMQTIILDIIVARPYDHRLGVGVGGGGHDEGSAQGAPCSCCC